MHEMAAVFKREFKAYLMQPGAYAMSSAILFVVGLSYYLSCRKLLGMSAAAMASPMSGPQLDLSTTVVALTISTIGTVSVVTVPVMTMRMWSAERRTGTAELLLTWPLRDRDIVLGKFFAALALYTLLLTLTLLYPLVTVLFGTLDPGPIISAYTGTFLMGAALLSLGFLCSTWTESQVLACTSAVVGSLLFWRLDDVADFAGGKLATLLTHLSFANHYDHFIIGVVETRNIAFFVLFSCVGLLLTLRSIASTRWRG